MLQFTDIGKDEKLIYVGCGEGLVMEAFHRHGILVDGLDFSADGIEKFNPHLLPFFKKGNIYELLEEQVRIKSKGDFLILANVIGHVRDPVQLLQKVEKIMHSNSIRVITAPNDFSRLQDLLLSEKKITKKYWLCYADHLSYFNKESMSNLLCDLGFKIHCIVVDNPVDLNLLNDNSNYIEDPAKG